MARKLTEAQFTKQVLQLAKLTGWRTLHLRPARTLHGWRTAIQGQGVGWPDVFAVHPLHGLLAAELKVGRGKLTAEQVLWLGALRGAGVPAFVWRPSDWPEIERVLREGVSS